MTSNEQDQPHRIGDRMADIMIGLPDGLTIPFVVAAGMCGLNANNTAIATVGLLVATVGAVAMGISRYFTGLPNDVPHRVQELGLPPEVAEAILQDHSKEKSKWDAFQEEFHLELTQVSPKALRRSAYQTSIAYLIGGLVPIIPFFLVDINNAAIKWAAIVSALFLFVSGYFKGLYSGLKPWNEAIRISVTGVVAATAAFLAAKILL